MDSIKIQMANQSTDVNGTNSSSSAYTTTISTDAKAIIYTLQALFGIVGLVIIVGIFYCVHEWFQRLCIKITWPDPPPLNITNIPETTGKKPVQTVNSNSSNCKLINESFEGDLYDDVEPTIEKPIGTQRRRDGDAERHSNRRRRRHRSRRRRKDNNNMLHSLRTSFAQFTASVTRNISHKPRAPSPPPDQSKKCTCCDEMVVNQNYDSVIFERQPSTTDNNSPTIENDQAYENGENVNLNYEKNVNTHTNSFPTIQLPPTALPSRNKQFSTLQTSRPNRPRRNIESAFFQNNALFKMVPPPLPKSKTAGDRGNRPEIENKNDNEEENAPYANSRPTILNENNLNINVVMGTDLYQNVTVNIDTVNQSATYANEPPTFPSAHTMTPKRARKPMPLQRTYTASNNTDV